MNVLEERRPTLRTFCWENRKETAYHTWLSFINSGEGKIYDDINSEEIKAILQFKGI